jgi:FkbM family methyltransferase
MKIAAFVTDFPLHLLCWLCDIIDGLAVRGVQVDLYLYKAGQPPQFRPGVRVIPLPEDGQSGSELVAEAAINAVRKIASGVPYDACISFESRALLLAKIASDTVKCPLIHHNFELYDPEHPGVWQKDFVEIKRLEGRLIREVDLFLIQDAAREREYFRILGTDNRPLNTMHFPVSLPRLADRPKPRYWHETYNLAPSTRVVFYIGQLTAARFVDRMIVAAQSFRPDQQLVVHGPFYNNTAALKQLTDLDEKRRVIFSTQLLAWDQIVRISASADIGLVMYRRQMINEFTTGRSSDKLARYLQSGIPVICPDFPSFREGVDAYHFGLCCSEYAQMPNLVNRICDDYATYQNGARRAFEEVYNLDRHLDALVPVLQRIGSDKKRIPSIHSTPSHQGIAGQSPIAGNTPSPAVESTIPTPALPPVTQTLGGDGTLFQYTHHVYLELSNLCNYAHLHKACPVAQLAQNKDILPSQIVEDVLDTLHRYGFRGRIGFHTYNEPLMDPRLTQFTRRARQACPDSEIYICTNGYYLDQTMAEELVQTGVNHIHVSAYSDSEQRRLEAIRVPVQYHVDRMTLDKRMDAYDKPETDDNRPCYSPLYQIIVTAAGRISLCCMDWKRQHCFGDLHKQSFEQAMKDPAMWSLYEQLSKGDRRLSLCKRCQFVRGNAEPEITMNQASPSAQSFNRSGGPIQQAPALPVAPTAPFYSRSTIAYGPRVVTPSTEPDPNRMLARAREHYENGRFDEAFDLYEQLSAAYPQSAVEILAEAYDLYRTIPDPDRYVLYQSRFFNFGIRPGDKVLDIGSGNVPFRLATHLADLTTRDNQLGRAGAPFKYLDGKPVIQCDIARMPFADREFDFAYCSHVLEHVDDPTAACKELMRIAKRGFVETPSPGKDLWLDTIAVSNHRWAVDRVGGKLVFTEYSPAQKLGLQNDILRDMHCSPQTPREKAFASLVYLKADRMNTMLLWEGSFEFEVRRLPQAGSSRVQSAVPAVTHGSASGNRESLSMPVPPAINVSAPASNPAPSSGIPVVQGWPLSRIGTDYGGAMIDPELVPIGGTVISAGVGEDISFDLELIRLRNCRVIGIDPTEKAARFVSQNPHPRFQFLQRALTEKGPATVRIYKSANPNYVSESVVLSHKTVAPEQSYEAQTVCLDELLQAFPDASLLKLDIEGAEFAVLNSVQKLEIPQLYIEFHHFCTGYTIQDTMHCIQRLTRMGYVVAHTAAKAAPLQQVTFIHSRCLSERSARQAVQHNQVCVVP